MRSAIFLGMAVTLALLSPAQAGPDAADAQATLAWKLMKPSKPGQDALVSPASLASAFAALDLAADAPMKAAILKTLGFDAKSPEAADLQLFAARKALTDADPEIFVTADRLVLPPPPPEPNPAFLADLDANGVGHVVGDTSKPETIADINAWVAETTKGKIDKILAEPLPHPAFVSLNALYFKGKWETPFDPKQTSDAPFHPLGGKAEAVKMMHLPSAHRRFRMQGGFVAVDLPFVGERYWLTVVTSADRPRALAEFAPAAKWLSGEGFSALQGDLALPRFHLDHSGDLLPALRADLADGLKSPTAFARIGGPSAIDGVVQVAKLDVDEEGAVAAAATAIMVAKAVAPTPVDVVHMVVDKPYLFALRDQQSGLLLMAGYVAKAPK